MGQAYDDYIAAKKAYDEAEAKVEALIGRLSAFAAPLIKNWRECHISLTGQGVPMNVAASTEVVHANDVPDPLAIHHAINAFHEAQQKGHRAWTSLSDQERKELIGPPWLKRRR